MPRIARLDAPGVLHHVMIRGIEGRKNFRNNKDRKDFIERLAKLCPEMGINCYAWAFMSNHAHFLFRTGQEPLSKLMRRLLTGYVIGFNRRHKRRGQLFQNRYKSIICQEVPSKRGQPLTWDISLNMSTTLLLSFLSFSILIINL